MALDDLQAVIESLQVKIESHRAHLSENETRTRQVLIDPLLRELGWDVSDPDQVQLEYSAGGGRADYALMSQGKPVAVIEAKRLGYRLDQSETMQVLNYANSRGIAHMAVTNGDEWRMYDVFDQKAIEERVIMEFSITRTPAHESALQSLRIWNPNLSSGSGPVGASESIVKTVSTPESLTRPRVETDYSEESSSPPIRDESLSRGIDSDESDLNDDETAFVRSITSLEGTEITSSVSSYNLQDTDWIPLSEVDTGWYRPSPKSLRFPDDSTISLSGKGKDLLIEIAMWLAQETDVNGWSSLSRGLGNAISFSGSGFRQPVRLPNGMYFDTFGSWGQVVRWSKQLLGHFGYKLNSVYVRFDPPPTLRDGTPATQSSKIETTGNRFAVSGGTVSYPDRYIGKQNPRDLRSTRKSQEPSDWYSLADRHWSATGSKPQSLKIDGSTYTVSSWADFTQTIGKYLTDSNKLVPNDCPVSVTHTTKKCFVNTSPVNPDGTMFRSARELSNGMWIETATGAQQHINYARQLLNLYNMDLNIFVIHLTKA